MHSPMFDKKTPNQNKNNTVYQHKHLIPTLKHDGGTVEIWVSFEATGPGQLAVIRLVTNFSNMKVLSILSIPKRPSV